MQDGKYWIDDDGYIAHGKADEYTTVSGSIEPLHVEPLSRIIEGHADLLAACESALATIKALTNDLLRANLWGEDEEQIYNTEETENQIKDATAKAEGGK